VLLTTVGEFEVKNLVLISAALVRASRLSDPHVRLTPSAGTASCRSRVVPSRRPASSLRL
jgi:hypothetical protein